MKPTTTTDRESVSELWGIRKVTAVLGCSSKTIERRVKAGILPRPLKDGRLNKYPADGIIAYRNSLVVSASAQL
jgi:predicted DNA-binding transcriptional regulator AlpA